MEDKDDDDLHCVHYVGESLDMLKRMKQGYPKILERFGVTDRIQVAQGGYTSGLPVKDQILLQESVVGAMIEGATNRTLRQGLALGETMKYLPFHKLSSANLVHGGLQGDVDDYGINKWNKMNYTGNEDKLVSTLNPPQFILDFIDQYQVVIQLANDLVIRDFFQPTVRQLCVGFGTLLKELGKGCFDKTKMPKAKTAYKDKNGNVIVDVDERYDNWGQVMHHTSKGIFVTNKLNHLAVVIEREHLAEGQLISDVNSLDEDMDFEDEDDDRDFKSLKKDYGDELLKMLKDARLNKQFESNGFRCLTEVLFAKCKNDGKHISDLDSLVDYPFLEANANAETNKYYSHLSSLYDDEELLEKIKEVYDRKCKKTRVFKLRLRSNEISFGFAPAIPDGKKNPIIGLVVDGSAADREGVKECMEIKSVNDEDVEGIGPPAQQVTDKVRMALPDRRLKLVVFKHTGWRKPK